MQRTTTILATALLFLSLGLIGCGGSQSDQAAETATDSLLAASPLEEPVGDLTPQEEFQEEQEPAAPPKPAAKPKPQPKRTPPPPPVDPGVKVPAGTAINLAVSAQISSETAQPGDTWEGVVTEPVIIGTDAPIPAGSTVTGVITGAKGAEKGSRAFLVLAVNSVTVEGKTHKISAFTDSIIAGSTRARNLGAIAGGAAAGALIGKAVGGSGKGALIGGLIGGAAATAGVATSKGYQVVLKEGTELTFNITDQVVMKQ